MVTMARGLGRTCTADFCTVAHMIYVSVFIKNSLLWPTSNRYLFVTTHQMRDSVRLPGYRQHDTGKLKTWEPKGCHCGPLTWENRLQHELVRNRKQICLRDVFILIRWAAEGVETGLGGVERSSLTCWSLAFPRIPWPHPDTPKKCQTCVWPYTMQANF